MHQEQTTLSIVVIFYNMQREAERTLFSLSTDYQENCDSSRYEVIALDNNSSEPLDAGMVETHGDNFRYEFLDLQTVSPAAAVNYGARIAKGKFVAIIVDGARMASPGLVSRTLSCTGFFSQPAIFSLSWHLGPEVQNESMLKGYDQRTEDALLESINWRENGTRLFDVATLAQSSGKGFLGGVPTELSWICIRRELFMRLGGFNEAFVSKGGGQVNHDFRNRLMTAPGIEPVMLLGEGVFHQFHGGVATNVPMAEHPANEFRAEYQRIHGEPCRPSPTPEPIYFGTMPENARKFVLPGY